MDVPCQYSMHKELILQKWNISLYQGLVSFPRPGISKLEQDADRKLVKVSRFDLLGAAEPHAVEALLIYLYTLEYPDRRLTCFRDITDVKPETSNFHPEKEVVVRLKSTAPQYRWQEHLSLAELAQKMEIEKLRDQAIGRLYKDLRHALVGEGCLAFIDQLWCTNIVGIEELRRQAISIIARENVLSNISMEALEAQSVKHPKFMSSLAREQQKLVREQQIDLTCLRGRLEGQNEDQPGGKRPRPSN